MALYLSVIIFFLSSIGLWEASLFKDFLFWLLTSALVMLLSFNKLKKNTDFKNILLKLLTVNIILEFIVSNYNFSLIKELLLIPFATFVSILIIVAQQKKKENEKVIKLLNLILSYIGFAIFCYVIYSLIKSPLEFFTVKNLKSFLLSPLLTILFIPFVFLVTIYSKYEEIFMNINRYNFLSNKRKSQIRFAFLKFGNLNLEYLNNAHNITIWRKAELLNEEEINLYIRNEIKNDVKFRE
jgi:4-hydroxybenzoate polyprenyltransferase